jgi:hypothetical protein
MSENNLENKVKTLENKIKILEDKMDQKDRQILFLEKFITQLKNSTMFLLRCQYFDNKERFRDKISKEILELTPYVV